MSNQCKQCNARFEVEEADRAFYRKIDVPEPKLCPDCRRIRLMAWRNERILYQRQCASCKAPTIACFSPNSPVTVVCNDCWWGSNFDPLAYGRDFDFSRPFFEQFGELLKAVPVGNLFYATSENSKYSNYSVGNKNCYMAIGSDFNEDSFYLDSSHNNRDSCDLAFANKTELCYEGVDIENCFQCHFCQNIKDSTNCFACFDLTNCQNCIGCVGLRGAQYAIFNKKVSKQEYEATMTTLKLSTRGGLKGVLDELEKLKLAMPRRFSQNIKCEHSTGNYLVGCRDCTNCFDLHESEKSVNVMHGYGSVDCMDGYGSAKAELAYNYVGNANVYDMIGTVVAWPGSSSLRYSFLSRTARNCFGCVSLHNNEYCILNKKYNKEEYDVLMARIKAHMQKTGEWGEFFPMSISPYAYNETIAHDFYPMTKEQALSMGGRWEDTAGGTYGKETLKIDAMPEDISAVQDSIVNETLACSLCCRNYKITKQELQFYRKVGVPIPSKCYLCRYSARIKARNPRHLWHRQCMCDRMGHGHGGTCAVMFQTTYAPERPEKIFCEDCYQKEIV